MLRCITAALQRRPGSGGVLARRSPIAREMSLRTLGCESSRLGIPIFHGGFTAEFDASLVVDPDTFDPDGISDFDDIFRPIYRKSASSEMWQRPSLPGRTSTKAPNSFVETTVPWYSSPTVISLVMPRMISLARLRLSPLLE